MGPTERKPRKALMTNMPSAPDSPTIFVVHGHNLAAKNVMVQFIRATGVHPRLFSDVVRAKAGTASILEIVESGLRGAFEGQNAIVVLLTPDDHAVPSTGGRAGSCWQPRQNVIFEAGFAYALGHERTYLTALGDVCLGSDLEGQHLIRLDTQDGLDRLETNLRRIKGEQVPKARLKKWLPRFKACVEPHWEYFDELADLERELKNCEIGNKSLYEILRRAVATQRGVDWAQAATPEDLIMAVYQKFDSRHTDAAYWWLVVLGVFRFQDALGTWWNDETWYESFDYTKLTARGRALLRKIHAETSRKPH